METRSSLQSLQSENSEKHYSCEETQSLTVVAIKIQVGKEVKELRSEGQADRNPDAVENQNVNDVKIPNQKAEKSLDLVSTMRRWALSSEEREISRHSRRKNKRKRYDDSPPSRPRRRGTPVRRERSYSRDRDRRSKSGDRGRRSNTRDRVQRSKSRGRDRRSKSRGRDQRSKSRDRVQRSKSRGRDRRSKSRGRDQRSKSRGRDQRSKSRGRYQRSKSRDGGRRSNSRGREWRSKSRGREWRGKSRGREGRSKSREVGGRSNSRDRSWRSKSRGRDRRSKSREASRRSKTRDRDRRSKSRDRDRRSKSREADRRSNSRDKGRRRSRSPSRFRRHDTPDRSRYSTVRNVRRSRSRSQHRSDGEERPRRSPVENSAEPQSTNSRNDRDKDPMDHPFAGNETPRPLRNSKSSPGNSSPSSESWDTDNDSVADPKQVRDIFSNNSTIDILRSRIQSTLKSACKWTEDFGESQSARQVFAKSHPIQAIGSQRYGENKSTVTSTVTTAVTSTVTSNGSISMANNFYSGESIAPKSTIAIDDGIIEKIVAQSAVKDSNVNVDETAVDKIAVDISNHEWHHNQMNNPSIASTRQIQDPRHLAQRVANDNADANSPLQYARIVDPRIQKMLNSRDPRLQKMENSPRIEPNRFNSINTFNTFESQQSQYLYSRRTESKSMPKTYGEYRKMQALGVTTNSKATVAKPMVIPKLAAKTMEIKIRKDGTREETIPHEAPAVVHQMPAVTRETRATTNDKRAVTNDKRAAVTNDKRAAVTNDKRAAVTNDKRAAVTNDKRAAVTNDNRAVTNDNRTVANVKPKANRTSSHSQSPDNINFTSSEETTSSSLDSQAANENALDTLKQLISPDDIHTLVDLVGQFVEMSESNALSLAKVKEALKSSATKKKKKNELDPKKKKKNELDRLHEDIDNMFIRDGVLNATGRQRSRDNSVNSAMKSQPSASDRRVDREPKIRNTPKTPVTSVPVYSNSEVPAPVRTFKRSATLLPNTVQKVVKKKKKKTPSVASEEYTICSPTTPLPDDVQKVAKEERPRQAPEDDIFWPPVPAQQVVKKKRASKAQEDDTIWLPYWKPKKNLNPKVVLEVIQREKVKNNNLEWHSLRKMLDCQICYLPPGISIISHYVNFHPNSEVPTSRLPPEAAERLRNSAPRTNRCERIGTSTFKQFCYFCNTYCTYTKVGWIDHMVRHTGYFHYKCSKCPKKFAHKSPHKCGKQNVKKDLPPIFQGASIQAYVCELCNYVRFYEDELKTHLDNEHEEGDVKEFKQFTFLILPIARRGRPSLKMEAECQVGFEGDYESVKFEEEDYAFQVQNQGMEEPAQNHQNGAAGGASNKSNQIKPEDEWDTISTGSDFLY